MELHHSSFATMEAVSTHKLYQGKFNYPFKIIYRIGSLHINIYIVNADLKIKSLNFEKDENGKNIFKSTEISYSMYFSN